MRQLRAQAASLASDARALLGMRVLLVDCSGINRSFTKSVLERSGAQLLIASSVQEAFERIQSEPRCFDAVLLAEHSAPFDGREVTRRVRLELKLVDLPIITLTSTASGDSRTLVNSVLRHVKAAGGHSSASAVDFVTERTPWPAIDGIDSTDARARLRGDFILFQSMLQRMLDEFSTLTIPAVQDAPHVIAAHGARMHKLRGSAGMLGAKAIHLLAGEAEAACETGDVERAALLVTRLIAQLKTLKENVARVREAHVKEMQSELPGKEELASQDLAPQDLAELLGMLHQQNLAATDRFNSIAPQLRRSLSRVAYEQVRDAIGDLQFARAFEVLKANSL